MSDTATYTNIDDVVGALFLRNADDPIKTHVMGLVHDWWESAPQSAIDEYAENLRTIPGADEFLAERYLPAPLTLDELAGCADGTLGHAYRGFIVDNGLEVNLARNYHDYHGSLASEGRLDRMPDDIRFAFVRGFMLHDFLHVITDHGPDLAGELGMAGFHYAQIRSIYHAMRTAVTTTHVAFVRPGLIEPAMDALANGWIMGRTWKNLHFTKWEEQLDRPLADIRAEYGSDEWAPASLVRVVGIDPSDHCS